MRLTIRSCCIMLFLYFQGHAQLSIAPTSTIDCYSYYTTVQFSITSGTPPFSYTIYTPGCVPNYTGSIPVMGSHYFSTVCQGTHTLSIKDQANILVGTVTHTTYVADSLNLVLGCVCDTICIGNVITVLPENNWGLSSYNWSDGSTTQYCLDSPTITASYSLTALYTYVHPVYSKTCAATGAITVYVKDCGLQGLREERPLNDFKFYPNPVADKLYLKFEHEQTVFDKIEIISVLGQVVFVQKKSNEEIDVSNLKTGVYFLKIEADNKIRVLKFLRE